MPHETLNRKLAWILVNSLASISLIDHHSAGLFTGKDQSKRNKFTISVLDFIKQHY